MLVATLKVAVTVVGSRMDPVQQLVFVCAGALEDAAVLQVGECALENAIDGGSSPNEELCK